MRRQLEAPKPRRLGSLIAFSFAVTVAALLTDPSAVGAQQMCFGAIPTHVAQPDTPTIGTSGPDVIVGTSGSDRIDGMGGGDRICAGAGADDVRGGSGNDRIDLGPGHDAARGGKGADLIRGRGGRDTIRGGRGGDELSGGKGRDTIAGGAGRDHCLGNGGADTMWSCATRDRAAFYIAVDGDDGGGGSLSDPWAGLQRGADVLEPGDTLFVRGGVYHQRLDLAVSGSPGAFVTVRNVPGETPILDGSGVSKPAGWAPLVRLHDRRYVRVAGFEIRNMMSTDPDKTPIAILVDGSGSNIEILRNNIHHIEHTGNGSANAHGVAVYGTSRSAIRDLTIERNELHHLVLGTSEALVLNGNVDGFEVTNNRVHHVDNIGIDAIGSEGVAPVPALDRARNGTIARNLVYDVGAGENPAYRERSAGGIYVDGAHGIVIERNEVHRANIGIEVAAEDPRADASDITVRHNLVHHNHIGGIFLGGFDRRRGAVNDCRVANNTIAHNDTDATGAGQILLQHNVNGCELLRNIVVTGNAGRLVANPFTSNNDNRLGRNLYWASANPAWEWRDVDYSSFARWRAETGNDASSMLAKPRFAAAARGDFSLRPTSPARGAGPGGQDLGATIAEVGL